MFGGGGKFVAFIKACHKAKGRKEQVCGLLLETSIAEDPISLSTMTNIYDMMKRRKKNRFPSCHKTFPLTCRGECQPYGQTPASMKSYRQSESKTISSQTFSCVHHWSLYVSFKTVKNSFTKVPYFLLFYSTGCYKKNLNRFNQPDKQIKGQILVFRNMGFSSLRSYGII